MYGDPNKAQTAVEKMHMTMQEAAAIARQASPGELWLTHFSPGNDHPEQYLEAVREIFPATVIPNDRRTVLLTYDKERKHIDPTEIYR